MTTTLSRRRVRLGAASVFAVFVLSGLTFASYVSRLPLVRDVLGLTADQLGLILTVGALGSLVSLPLSGRVVGAIGPVRTVLVGTVVAAAGLATAVAGVETTTVPLVAAGLFGAMFGIGAWDMAMNYAGTRVEQALGRAIMPWFHAGFSLGAVLGGAGGTIASALGVGLAPHLAVVLGVVLVGVAAAVRGFLTQAPEPETVGPDGSVGDGPDRSGYLGAWREPRTLLIGLVVLAAALTEGAANDWLALAVVDGFGVGNELGALGFTVFMVAMTTMRFLGTWLLDRLGRVVVLRICTSLAIVGLLVFVLVDVLPIALAGAVLWGLGAALGFPVGMSAASDEPARAAARLSVVATIGYTAFLLGPPLLGFLAHQVGYRPALLAIVVPLLAGLLAIRAAAPRPTTGPTSAGPTPAGPDTVAR